MTLQDAKAMLVHERLDKSRPRGYWFFRDFYRVISARN